MEIDRCALGSEAGGMGSTELRVSFGTQGEIVRSGGPLLIPLVADQIRGANLSGFALQSRRTRLSMHVSSNLTPRCGRDEKSGGEGEIRTHVPELPDHPISSRRRYDRFGTSPRENLGNDTWKIRAVPRGARILAER